MMPGHVIVGLSFEGRPYQILLDIPDYEKFKTAGFRLRRCPRSIDYVAVYCGKLGLARLVLGYNGKNVVDHVSGDTLDNRRSNLRIITPLQNSHNRKGHSNAMYSKYKGISFDKTKNTKPWYAKISIKGVNYKKNFDTELEAALQYDEWAKKYHGEYAHLNFPEKKD